MNNSRDDLLGLLKCIGVELPRLTKLPNTELEKRLSKVLDSCQYLSRVVPSLPLDPTRYPTWDKTKCVLKAVARHNFGEATLVYEGRTRGVENPFPLYENAFMDLRQSMMSIGNTCDKRSDSLIFQDKEQQSCICMRVLEVREFDAHTPIFLVIFCHDTRSYPPNMKGLAWVMSNVRSHKAETVANVTATLQEQKLLLQLLKQNSKRLAQSYNPKRADTEQSFTLSFLLPVGPLGVKEMGTFNRNDGCSVCGSPAKSKCSRCGAIRYCSAVCQKEDWKNHRPTCTSLMGGTWQSLNFASASHPFPGVHALKINRFTNVFDPNFDAQIGNTSKNNNHDFQSPPNIHGRMPFIVKVQLNSHEANWALLHAFEATRDRPYDTTRDGTDGTNMLIYDRQRTFEVHAWVNDPGFEATAKMVKSKGERGLKVFCWAVRTGEWTMDVCLDHLPEWQKW